MRVEITLIHVDGRVGSDRAGDVRDGIFVSLERPVRRERQAADGAGGDQPPPVLPEDQVAAQRLQDALEGGTGVRQIDLGAPRGELYGGDDMERNPDDEVRLARVDLDERVDQALE